MQTLSHYSPSILVSTFIQNSSKLDPPQNQQCTSTAQTINTLKCRFFYHCKARRRVRYEAEQNDEEDEYGYNVEIGMLELYSQSVKEEALIVKAIVDEQQEEVLIFKGFSSCLSNWTSPDPSKSVLPARAVIKTIDRVRGPFNSINIEYIEKGLTWEAFKSRFESN